MAFLSLFLPTATAADWLAEAEVRVASGARAIHATSSGYAVRVGDQVLTFGPDGLRAGDVVLVHTLRWGRGEDLAPVTDEAPAFGDCTDARDPLGGCVPRLEYTGAGVSEWWRGTAAGLEQGWTMDAAPGGAGPLVFEVAVASAWHVGELRAWDADGRAVPVRSTRSGGALRLEVDDAGATYPLTVDPVYSSPAWTLEGPDPTGLRFGVHIAGGGDVDGDGYADVIIGSEELGVAGYLYRGAPAGPGADADAAIELPVDLPADSIAIIGDVDGDGIADVAVGISDLETVYVFPGSPDGVDTSSPVELTGTTSFGMAVAGAGDVDGDGYDDLLVGADLASPHGAAYLYAGGPAGISTSPTTLVAPSGASKFGWALAGAGDVDGDGYDDVVCGDYAANSYKGLVAVYPGGPGGLSTTALVTYAGTASYGDLGLAVASAGDVNGDGFGDVIVGEDGGAADNGGARVYLGSSTGLEATPSWQVSGTISGGHFGSGVAGVGDVDGDGYDDVVVGAYADDTVTGRAFVYQGSGSGLGTAPTEYRGTYPGAAFGRVVSGLGDLDGDGYDDFAIGSPYALGDVGRADLWRGGPTGPTSVGGWSGEYTPSLGGAVSGVGDVNGDGFDDAVVALTGWGHDAGAAWLFLGSSSGFAASPDQGFEGAAESDAFACSAVGAGDLDGDGYGDVLIGASHLGGVYVYSGGPLGLHLTSTILTGSSRTDFGRAVGGGGDVDGDGYDDVVIGAPEAGRAGRAYVHLGGPSGLSSAPVATLEPDTSGAAGWSVAIVGDVNGDGYADVAVGDPLANGQDGRVTVFDGGPTGVSTSPAFTVDGATHGGELGRALSPATDLDGDGYGDLVVSAPGDDPDAIGWVYIYPGGPAGLSADNVVALGGLVRGLGFGASLDAGGDTDGDGYDDLVVGTTPPSGETGHALVFRGGPGGVAPLPGTVLSGAPVDSHSALQVAIAGDVDGDGAADVLVADASFDDDRGEVYLYRGGDPDEDADGSADDRDCDPSDPAVGRPGPWYPDSDGDGAGDEGAMEVTCHPPAGWIEAGGDCDDTRGDIHPRAREVCDGLDNNCDGRVDEGAPVWFLDGDGDGYGSPATASAACEPPTDAVWEGRDCDDADAAVNPSAPETCNDVDDDCDGSVDDHPTDGAPRWRDGDGDGWGRLPVGTGCPLPGAVSRAGDCDDADPAVSPAAAETCNGVDDDCDGRADDGVTRSWYPDADGDGWGEATAVSLACAQPAGTAARPGDCDDADASVSPAAPETRNGVDDDCDGRVDEGTRPS